MSAHSVVGIDSEIARALDEFWASLDPEEKAALHIAFNLKKADVEYRRFDDEASMLRNARSTRGSIANVRGDFFHFMKEHINECPDDEAMMRAILA